ncbi:MAG: hypothetical protein ACP6IY_19240 [Promethearchaeia archaeon]
MNDEWINRGLNFLKKLNSHLTLKELEDIFNENYPQMRELLLNFLQFIGGIDEITENMNEINLNYPIDKFFNLFLEEYFNIFNNNPDYRRIPKIFDDIYEILNSTECYRELFSFPSGDIFEDRIKKKFLKELDKAEQVSKNAVAKSFKIALEYIQSKQSPNKIYQFSKYNKLGIKTENLKIDTTFNFIISFIEMIFNKEEELYKQSKDEIIDIISDLISRFGRAIEPYLKVIIGSIYNLQNVYNRKKFDYFNKRFGYYLGSHSLMGNLRSEKEDYIDYRNAIKHDDFEISFNQDSNEIKIKFNLKRFNKGKIQWSKKKEMELKELRRLFSDFRQFQNNFIKFYKIYINSIYKENQ